MKIVKRMVATGAAAVVAASTLGAAPAVADDHRPPKAVLRTPGKRQVGNKSTWTWARPDGKYCSLIHADGFYAWPRRLLYRSGAKARIRLKRDERPAHSDIFVYRSVDQNGTPTSDARRVEHRMRRRETDRGVVWELVFRRHRIGHHYLVASVEWAGRGECSGGEADYTFHLKAR